MAQSHPISYTVLHHPSELQELHVLFQKVFVGEAKHADTAREEVRTSIPASVCAIGAMHGTALVGGLIAYELPLLNGTREMYLYDIGVLPAYQKQGIGRALMDTLHREAKRRGITTIFVEAESDDVGAVAFYRSLGGEEVKVCHFNLEIE